MMNTSELCIPVAAVALDGVAPAVGDPVNFPVDATVVRTAGDKLYVRVTAAAGQPVDGVAGEPAAEQPEIAEPTEDAARTMGAAYDDQEEAIL